MAKEMRQRSGRSTVPKIPIGSTNDWWGMKDPPNQSFTLSRIKGQVDSHYQMAKEMRQRSGRLTVPNSPIGSTNDWWGMKGTPQSKFHFIIVIENKRNQQPGEPVSKKKT